MLRSSRMIFAADGRQGVRPLVVGVIDVHAHDAPVGRERVAVAAHRQVRQDDGRLRGRRHGSHPPRDARRVLDGVDERQGHVAVEDRGAHRVGAGPDVNLARRQRLRRRRFAVPQDDDARRGARASPLDGGPGRGVRHPLHLARSADDRPAAVPELDRHHPPGAGTVRVGPTERGRDDLRREHRPVERVRDGETGVRGIRSVRGQDGRRFRIGSAGGARRQCQAHPRQNEQQTDPERETWTYGAPHAMRIGHSAPWSLRKMAVRAVRPHAYVCGKSGFSVPARVLSFARPAASSGR